MCQGNSGCVAEMLYSANHSALQNYLKGIQSCGSEILNPIADKAQETQKYSLFFQAGSAVLPLRDTPFPAAHPFHLPAYGALLCAHPSGKLIVFICFALEVPINRD